MKINKVEDLKVGMILEYIHTDGFVPVGTKFEIIYIIPFDDYFYEDKHSANIILKSLSTHHQPTFDFNHTVKKQFLIVEEKIIPTNFNRFSILEDE